MNFHGRQVPPPPSSAPPPLPSHGNRQVSQIKIYGYASLTIINSMQSPQMSGHPKKGFQPQTLTPLMETSESRTSTISRPAPPPNVQPPQPTVSLKYQLYKRD